MGPYGNIYVLDYGDNKVKAFSEDGTYLTTYGEGPGKGPGQMMSINDLGVRGDSLVYVVDSRQRKISFFDRENGDFLRVETYDETPISRMSWSAGSTKYVEAKSRTSDFLIMTTSSGHQRSVSQITDRDYAPIALDGLLHTSHGQGVYVPYYFPVILTYNPADTTGNAYPTPDYGEVSPPEARTESGGRIARRPTNTVNGPSTLHNGMLSVMRPATAEDSLEFDLYDVEEMEYMYTVRLPIRRDWALYARQRVAVVEDTTVSIYRVLSNKN